ncbi:MAG: trimethylamine methyltransferase family protein [Planctomycetota bacterium]
MAGIRLQLLSSSELDAIRGASLRILSRVGVKVHHEEILELLGEAGADVDRSRSIAHLPERLVLTCAERAQKSYILYGRDGSRSARFGHGDRTYLSSPGQYGWIDLATGVRRPPTLEDARAAIRLGDALEGIHVVGPMAQPAEIPEAYRDVALTAELVRGTAKPTRSWVRSGASARYVLEIYAAAAGGWEALRRRPMTEAFLEPVSPLQLPRDGLDVLREFVRAGQPVSIGPMAMAAGTAPATLAGTLAQENAEVLAGVVVAQVLAPGTPVTYGGIPHVLDPRTSICSFGSPEQGLMAVAMVEIARSYGFPVYVNVGLTDAKVLDAQAGAEKAASLLLGALAGADTFGHCGICGTDHAGSLAWLVADEEIARYVERILRGFEVGAQSLGEGAIEAVGPGGDFLSEPHTVRWFRREIWIPGAVWTREGYEAWRAAGATSFGDRAAARARELLAEHAPAPIAPELAREIEGIVERARRELRT